MHAGSRVYSSSSATVSSSLSSIAGLTAKNTFLDAPSPWQDKDFHLPLKASSDPLTSTSRSTVTESDSTSVREGQPQSSGAEHAAAAIHSASSGGAAACAKGWPVRAEDIADHEGDQVERREEDWTWGDQDGGPGGIGFLRADPDGATPPGWIHVVWRSGTENDYRAGAMGKFDLQYIVDVGRPRPPRGEAASSSWMPGDVRSAGQPASGDSFREPSKRESSREGHGEGPRAGRGPDEGKRAAKRVGSPGPLVEKYGKLTACARRRLQRSRLKHKMWVEGQQELAARGLLNEAELAKLEEAVRRMNDEAPQDEDALQEPSSKLSL